MLLSMDGSTNRRNEIILGGKTINVKNGISFGNEEVETYWVIDNMTT